jgi:beta-lactamase regulating signal transducer with metallopeptidase domain
MNGAGAGLPVLLAGLLVKTTVVLMLALAVARASKARPAAFRHFLLSAALIGVLLLPLLVMAPVGWRSDLVPAWLGPPSPISTASKTGAGAAVPGPPAARIADHWSAGSRTVGTSFASSAVHVESAAADHMKTTTPLSGPATVTPARPSAGASPDPGSGAAAASLFGPALAVLWAAGFAALVLRLLIGLAGAARLTSEGNILGDQAWRVLVERFLALVSLRRPVRLRSHPSVLVPLTWGWRKPVVLLPDGADGWSEDERSSALFHELSHIKRADFLVMLLVRLSLALFWWNPLCWVVYRELLKEQEIACDELVLRAGIRPSIYAASLLAFRRAAGFRWNPSAALLGMLGRSSFHDRLAAILKQKLTFREVQMKTKIMVAMALVLAVALIGSARPAAGREAGEARTVLAPTEIAAPVPFELAFAGIADQQTQTQTEKAKEAEKAKQAEKAKEAEKAKQAEKTVVIKPVVVEGHPLEIVITEGDQVKKLHFDKPLTITREKNSDAIILTIDGQEAQVLKGVPLRLEIKGGELVFLKEGKPVEIDEDTHLDIAKEIVTEGGVVYLTPRPKAGQTFTLVKKGETDKDGVKFIVETHKEGEPTMVWSIKEGQAAQHVTTLKHKEGEPLTMAWTAKPAQGFALAGMRDKEMLEKVRALQEQVQAIKAKKMDLSALEESLKKLEQELQENEKKIKEMTIKLDKAPGEYTIVKKIGEGEAESKTGIWISEKEGQAAIAGVAVSTGEKDASAIRMVFTGHKGAEGKAAFERAEAALKKALPEGYAVIERKLDEESGTISFKIKVPEGQKVDETLVRKVVDAVKDVLSEK